MRNLDDFDSEDSVPVSLNQKRPLRWIGEVTIDEETGEITPKYPEITPPTDQVPEMPALPNEPHIPAQQPTQGIYMNRWEY